MVVDEMIPTIKKGQTIFYAHKGQTNIFCLDKQHLKNVLTNLLSNACKYSAEGKNIWLTSAKKNGQMQFTVKDEGIGIPEEDQPNLFQTFFRANNAGNIQGTGMGLHIVKRFLDIMGGNVHVKSKLNEGAEFVIQFPVQRQLN
jgi:signal transduction histidine kinase